MEKQCIAAVKQGNKVLGMIKRNFVDRSKDAMMANKSLVRPHLEYCTLTWSLHLIKDIKLVGVQREIAIPRTNSITRTKSKI